MNLIFEPQIKLNPNNMKCPPRRARQILAMLAAGALFFAQEGIHAMEMNMAVPFSSKMSGPAVPELAFYSKQSDNLLFPGDADVEIRCRAGLRCVGLKYEVRRNTFATPFLSGEAEALPGNIFLIHIPAAKLPYAGFYDVWTDLDAGEAKPIRSACTFGWRVDELKVRDSRPADFDAFWAKGKAELAKIPLDPSVGPFTSFQGKEIDAYNLASAGIPGDYDPTGHKTEAVEAAKVSFAGAEGTRVYGWLAKPIGSGPFPAMLVLPGAGFSARPMPLEHARHGYLALDIQVHGQDVDLPGEYPKLPGYYDHFTFDPPEAYYYHHIYLNALQALNYLASRPDVDPRRIVVVGGSQGGRLTVAMGALDSRVAAIVPAIAHHGNVPYTWWSDACNQAAKEAQKTGGVPDNGMSTEIPPLPPDTAEQKCLPYYDTMNFAPDVQCPVLMNSGLIDGVSPPTSVFAIYHRLGSADKTLIPLPGLGHDWSSEFDRRAWRWLDEELAKR